MSLARALAMPFQLSSLLLVAFIALMAAFCMAFAHTVTVVVIFPLMFLLSWLNKYACALLDHAANGVIAAPVASTDMLGPFGGMRPLVHVALGVAIAALLRFGPQPWGKYLGLAALLLLPASIGAAALRQHSFDAVFPPALWRVLRGLGFYYLPLLAAMAACAAGIWWLAISPLWLAVSYLLMALLWLCLHSLLGATLYLRRAALGFVPTLSPEWFAERDALEHERRRQGVIDAVYTSIRVSDVPRARAALLAWLAATDPGQHQADAQAILAKAAHWPEQRGLRSVARTLVAQFMKTRQLPTALATAEAALAQVGDFELDSAADTEALAQYALACGRTRVAQQLRGNFARAGTPTPRGGSAPP